MITVSVSVEGSASVMIRATDSVEGSASVMIRATVSVEGSAVMPRWSYPNWDMIVAPVAMLCNRKAIVNLFIYLNRDPIANKKVLLVKPQLFPADSVQLS